MDWIHLLIYWFIDSLIVWFIDCLIHSFIHSVIHSLINSFLPSFLHSFIHSSVHWFIFQLVDSLIHSHDSRNRHWGRPSVWTASMRVKCSLSQMKAPGCARISGTGIGSFFGKTRGKHGISHGKTMENSWKTHGKTMFCDVLCIVDVFLYRSIMTLWGEWPKMIDWVWWAGLIHRRPQVPKGPSLPVWSR